MHKLVQYKWSEKTCVLKNSFLFDLKLKKYNNMKFCLEN